MALSKLPLQDQNQLVDDARESDGASPGEATPSRLSRWLAKPSAERNRRLVLKLKDISALPFYLGMASFLNVYLSRQPDSYSYFDAHPEFHDLFKKFTKHNRANNAGDVVRLWSFILNLKQVMSENVEGDFAELGVWRGNTASLLAYFAARNNRRVVLFDTFQGFDGKDLKGIDADKIREFDNTSVDLVKGVIGENSKACEFVKGHFPNSIAEEHKSRKYAVVSLDCDLYEPLKAGLDFFYPRMPRGGLFLVHDYSSLFWTGAKQAVDEFCSQHDEHIVLMPDKSGSAFFRKSK